MRADKEAISAFGGKRRSVFNKSHFGTLDINDDQLAITPTAKASQYARYNNKLNESINT